MDKSSSRWAVLALLRFLLASIVVSAHLTWFVPAGSLLTHLQPLGGLSAVLGFLFVSGYSIAHSLDRRPGQFYGRRTLRIYPLYAACVLFSLAPFIGHGSIAHVPGRDFVRPTWRNMAINLVFLQNSVGLPLASNDVVWTLAVEVTFYALAPWLARTSDRILTALVVSSAVAYVMHQALGLDYFVSERWGTPVVFLAWAWVGGFLLYRRSENVVVVAGMLALTAIVVNVHVRYATTYSVSTACVAVLVVATCKRSVMPRWLGRASLVLGDLSYPLYLFHLPAMVTAYVTFHIVNQWALVSLVIVVSGGAMLYDAFVRSLFGKLSLRPKEPLGGGLLPSSGA